MKVIVSVTNDLIIDKRVDRVCNTLSDEGHDVILIGRQLSYSQKLGPRKYETKRLRLFFNKGPLFYTAYNIQLFLFLLFNKADLLIANDLDTLLANYMVSKIKDVNLIYDTHEYFCHVPELDNRPFVKGIWLSIEARIFPKLKHIITVNNSLAEIYGKAYGVELAVIRNVPNTSDKDGAAKSRRDLGLPEDKKIIVYQGAVNKDRGLEESILAMRDIDAVLLIVGDGDISTSLKELTKENELENKILFTGRVPFEQLPHYTANADLGLALEKDSNLNYKYSLSNKIFDYIHAGIPILATPLAEVKLLFEKYEIGDFIASHDSSKIAEAIGSMLTNTDKRMYWADNCRKAAEEYCWEKEQDKLLDLLPPLRS